VNFLAHCALAHDAALAWDCSQQERDGLLAGAVLGDFVKGRIPAQWPIALQAGTRLHRKIDALSNINPSIRDNCNRFPAHLRRFAPIFVDMLADHCLSQCWDNYYEADLPVFTQECYRAIDHYAPQLEISPERFLTYMKDVDLLANYHHWPHVSRGLESVLRRLNRTEILADVEHHSHRLIEPSLADFDIYFPQLRAAWQEWNAFTA
jgi:acyl carrier protein phosphodiesterase